MLLGIDPHAGLVRRTFIVTDSPEFPFFGGLKRVEQPLPLFRGGIGNLGRKHGDVVGHDAPARDDRGRS